MLLVLFVLASTACRGELTTAGADVDGTSTVGDPKPFDGAIPGEEACADTELNPGPALGRRLTNWEYAFTLRDVLGVDVDDTVQARFDEDLRTEGFTNTSTTLIVNLDRVLAYEELSAAVVDQIGDFPAFVTTHTDCTDFEASCQNAFIDSVGGELFRRPLRAEERDIFSPLFDVVAGEGDSFDIAARLVLEAMLQSPQFLYRLEYQGPSVEPLDGWAMATRLSYLVWSSAPDDELIRAARAGELATEAQIESQVRRMLADPKSRRASERFVRDWLYLDRLEDFQRDESLYPEYSEELGRQMQAETIAVAQKVLRDDGRPLTDLFVTQETIASRELAEFYGFDNLRDGVNSYDLSGHAQRVGVLTHAGVLASAGGGNEPSLVQRGIFVLHEVMCRSVDQPSVDIDTDFRPSEPGKSQRFYSEQRLRDSGCAGCHNQFDPLGYGFDVYDGVGQPLTEDFAGNLIESSGHFVEYSGGGVVEYDSTADYMEKLSTSETVRDCMIQKPAQFALGRALLETDACMLADIKSTVGEGEKLTFDELLVAIAIHPNFRHIAPAGADQ
jgi:hypothetical protein